MLFNWSMALSCHVEIEMGSAGGPRLFWKHEFAGQTIQLDILRQIKRT